MFPTITATKYNLHLCSPEECCEDICGDITASDLDELIYASKQTLKDYADSKVSGLYYFGEGKIADVDEKFQKLSLYKWALEYNLDQMLRSQDRCLCDETILVLTEEVKDIVDLYCLNEAREDRKVDTTNLNAWVLANPNCVAHEKWEKLLVTYCGKIDFNINVIKTIIDYKKEQEIDFDIVKATGIIGDCCAECNIEIKIKVNEKNCKLQYELIKTVENCDLTYKEFKQLKECGISYKSIKDAYECGLQLKYSTSQSCPVIKTNITEVPICSSDTEQSVTLT